MASATSKSAKLAPALARWMRADDSPGRLGRRVFWAGFLVRVIYITVAHSYRFRLYADHFEYGWEMGRIARSLATGHGYASPFYGPTGPTAWTPPVYPLLLAGAFKVFGVYTLKSAWVILAINSAFSAATSLAIYEMAMRCFSSVPAGEGKQPDARSIALWSAWLWALYPAAMQYAVRWVWDMALTAFLFSWALVLALKLRGVGDTAVRETGAARMKLWTLFGLGWGLIALSNSSLVTFLPVSMVWIVWPAVRATRSRGVAGGWRSVRGPLLSATLFLAVIAPWIVRNYLVFHAFVPMRSNFGAELYEATLYANDGFPWMATLPLNERAVEYQRFKQMGELAYCREQGEIAKAKIRAHPGIFLEHAIRRVYLFWVSVPHSTDDGWFTEAARRINYCFVSFAGLMGLALALRRRVPGAWLFFWAFAICPFLYYFITVQARFRHPLEPVLCILSVYLFQSAERGRRFSRGSADDLA